MVDSDTETKYVCKDSGLSESDVNEDDVSLQQKNKGKRLVFSDSDEDTTVASRQKQSLSKMIKVKQRKKARKKQSAGKDKHMIKKKKKHKKDYESSLQISVPKGRRKKRKRFVVYDSDVDTTIKAKKKQAKDSKFGKPKTSVVDTWFSIKNRCSPTQLTRVVKSLTSRQKEIVERLGFGKLLSLQLDGIPQKLGHFVVQNFNEVRMEICLENGVIKIDVEAIHRLLGIPKTGLNLKSMPAMRRLCPRIQQWRNLYGKEFISPKDIASRMAVDISDDSLDFELDFLMLFMSTMVECQAHGKCRLEMLDYLDDYIDLSVINWSAYVLDCIKRCKSGWEPFTKKPFKGALTILTLLYVERFSCEGVDVDETKTTIEFWTLDKLHEREALEISGGGFGNGKYIPLSADDCPNKNGSTLQDRPSSSDMYGLEKQLSFLNNLLEVTRENKKRLETDLGIMIHQHPGDVKVKKLMVGFEEVFKQKILVEEAEPHNGVNATISKSDAEASHEHDKDDGESPHSGKKRLEKSHEDSPDSVVNLSDSSPIMKGQVVGIRKSDIKKLKLASAAKSDVVHVDSSPVDKDKHRTPQVNLTVDGGHVELQTTGVLFGNIHEPSFSLGMTQEGIGNVTPNNLVKKAGSKEVVHVHSTLSKQSVLKRKSRVRFDVSGQMKVDVPSFSLGMTQEGLEKPVMETPVEGARKKPLEGPSFSLGMTQDESEAPKTDDKKSGKLDVDKTEARRNPTRLKVVSRDCKSPFVQREVVIKNRYTSEEKAIWKLIFAGDNERKETQRAVWDKVFETVSEEKTEIFFLQTLEPGNHFYVIVFEFKNPAIYVLDNMQHGVSPVTYKDDSDYHKKSTPYKVKHFMMLYLRQWKNPKVERLLMESIQPVQLEWATTDNVTDCGIFTMRHMEMFMGSYKKFECGFKKVESQQKKQINTLRKKYASRILISSINVHREKVLKEAGLKSD
ncbi:hypothetical protein E3N88_22166 [Mikania micrantha]|uniref:Ubiquitin-like protease family profile domain-containing protein n=1 Tax=Mikania micrantha TaxID=192012 RepID=A0A5N6NC80_9ASTR|nr:hypothetical protein E3N88_22166 [Mikania micrantha]